MTPNAILQLINLVHRINSQLAIENLSTAVAESSDAEGADSPSCDLAVGVLLCVVLVAFECIFFFCFVSTVRGMVGGR